MANLVGGHDDMPGGFEKTAPPIRRGEPRPVMRADDDERRLWEKRREGRRRVAADADSNLRTWAQRVEALAKDVGLCRGDTGWVLERSREPHLPEVHHRQAAPE